MRHPKYPLTKSGPCKTCGKPTSMLVRSWHESRQILFCDDTCRYKNKGKAENFIKPPPKKKEPVMDVNALAAMREDYYQQLRKHKGLEAQPND